MPPANTEEFTPISRAIAESRTRAQSAEFLCARLRDVICRSVRQICTDAFDRRLAAIVLTGSLARDEATFAWMANSFSTFGDAEFLLVLKKRQVPPHATHISALRQRIEENLLAQRIICRIDLSAVRPDYFRRLPSHIFSYELKHCGRVIWGDISVLEEIPEFSTTNLSREDAARLLANRLVELLGCAPEIVESGGSASPTFQYKLLKLYLDMATSLLVFLKNYAPTYRERQQVLSRLAARRTRITDVPFDRSAFAKRVAACTDWKLSLQENLEVAPGLSWREAVQSAHSLWRWELIQLTGSHLSISDEELFNAWKRMQPRNENLRAWARALRSCGWRRSCRQWLRWLSLCWSTSPRFGVYQAAFDLLFTASALPNAGPNEIETITRTSISGLRRLLPLFKRNKQLGETNDPLQLAGAIVSNYQEFLVGTHL